MPIDFSSDRWERVRRTFRRFWSGTLDRPVVLAQGVGRDPGRPMPKVPCPNPGNVHDFTWTPEQIVDRLDWDYSCRTYL